MDRCEPTVTGFQKERVTEIEEASFLVHSPSGLGPGHAEPELLHGLSSLTKWPETGPC